MDNEQMRVAVMNQLDRPMEKILAIIEDRPTLAEQRERVAFGERCLWGASIIMSVLGIPDDRQASSAVGVSWWMLFDLVEATRARWPADERAEWDIDRYQRRQAVWDEVANKLSLQGVTYSGKPFAEAVQRSTDEPPRQKYAFDVRYGQEKGRLDVRDPFTGEWHDIAASAAPFTWRAIAKDTWLREKASHGDRGR
jgi:hypothetical protein